MGRGAGRLMGFPNVTLMTDRHGKPRYRYRRAGQKTVYLPGKPGSPEFEAAYRDASAGVTGKIQPGASRTVPGTINALAIAFYASAEWRDWAATTQSSRRNIIERMREKYGANSVAAMRPSHVQAMRDKFVHTPAAANNFLKVLRAMMKLAIALDIRSDNPCIGIKSLKITSDGHKTWSEEEVAQYESFWPVGTRQRLAFDLLLGTVQRSGDVRQMGRQHAKNGRLEFKQQKTGAALSLPVVPGLQQSLDSVDPAQMLYIVTQFGVGYTAKGFGNWFNKSARKAGLIRCTAHGLRKTGATRLADKGHSESVIMSWTGHKSSKEVQRYIQARDQRSLADLGAGLKTEQTLSNPTTRLAKSGDN